MSISKENISGLKQKSGIKDSMAGSEESNNFKLFAKYSAELNNNTARQNQLNEMNEMYPSTMLNAEKQSSSPDGSSIKESNKKNDDNIAINLVSHFDVEVDKHEINNDTNNVKNNVMERPIEEQKDEIKNDANNLENGKPEHLIEEPKHEINNDTNNVKNNVMERHIEEQKNEIENSIKEVKAVPQKTNNDENKNNKIPVKNEQENKENNKTNNISQKQVPQEQVSPKQAPQTKKNKKQKNNSKNNLLTKDKTKQISTKNKKKEPKKNITKQRSDKINATSNDEQNQREKIMQNVKKVAPVKNLIIKAEQAQKYVDNVLKEKHTIIEKLRNDRKRLMSEMQKNREKKVFSANHERVNKYKAVRQLDQEIAKLEFDENQGGYNYTFFPNTVKFDLLKKKHTAKAKVNTKKTVKKDSVLNKKKTGQAKITTTKSQTKITTTKTKKEPKPRIEKTLSSNLNKIDKKNDIHEESKRLVRKTLSSNLNKMDKKEVIPKEQNDKKKTKNINKGALPEDKGKKQENIDLTEVSKEKWYHLSINMERLTEETKQDMKRKEKEIIGAAREKLKKVELTKKDRLIKNDNELRAIINNLKPVPPKEQKKGAVNNINNNEIIEEKKEEKKENNNIQVQKPQEKVDKKNNKTTGIKKNFTKTGDRNKIHSIARYQNMSASNNINKNPKIILKSNNKGKELGKQ